MRNMLTITRRELSAYFTSPVGYIFIIVFVSISVGLYITSFFTFPTADMRLFFGNLPIMLCVFIPAITMRAWAEERKENTWEMLLTFPMRAWELVMGKFCACLIFFTLALVCTLTVPIMLARLGNPDNGAVVSGYLGTVLLGAYFLAIGIFFSGFFKDQIVAFVITLLVCIGIFLVGTSIVASIIDDRIPGLGTMLSQAVGLGDHFQAFTRGVIEVAHILYFVAWTAVFLFLNIMYIDGRNRVGSRLYFGITAGVCLVIGLFTNQLVAGMSLGRFDVTEDKIYTVSDASKRILTSLDAPVQIKYYVTPKSQMPTLLASLERDISDKLTELSVASGGKLQFTVVHLEVATAIRAEREAREAQENEEDGKTEEEQEIEQRMLDKGVQPFSVQAIEEDQITNKLIYSSIGIGYKDREEEIIPKIVPQQIQQLEYLLVSAIYKLTRDQRPKIALVAPKQAVNIAPELRRMLEQMGQAIPETDDPYQFLEQLLEYEKYDFERVEISANSPLPEEYDTLVIVNPRSLNDRQRWEIARALRSGKSVIMAIQNYIWEYSATSRGIQARRGEETPEINPLLAEYGLGVEDDILMDINHVALNVNSSGNAIINALRGGQPFDWPTHMVINNTSMDPDTSITSRLSAILYLWGTALTLDEEKIGDLGLEIKTLMSSTDQSWTVSKDLPISEEFRDPPATGGKKRPLMVMVTGQFPDAFEDFDRPTWPVETPQPGQPPPLPPPDEDPPEPVEPAQARLILLGSAEMFHRSFLQSPGHMDLFMNCVDAVTLSEDLVYVRGRKPINRAIDTPGRGSRQFWKTVNYGLASTIVAVLGIVTTLMRRRSRNAYTLGFVTPND